MTVSSPATQSAHTWTGIETVFATGIEIRFANQLLVSLTGADGIERPLTLGVHYDISIIDGIAVVAPIALPTTGVVTIVRHTSLKQEQTFPSDDNFAPEAHELAHDLAAMRLAELRRDTDALLALLDLVGTVSAEADRAVTAAQNASADVRSTLQDLVTASTSAADTAVLKAREAAASAAAASGFDPASYYPKLAVDAALAAKVSKNGDTLSGTLSITGSFPTKAVFRNNGAGDVGLQFFSANRQDTTNAEIGQRASGAGYVWIAGQNFLFQPNGDLSAPANLIAGSGSAWLQTDGNVVGPLWTNWGSSAAFTAIGNRIESRIASRASMDVGAGAVGAFFFGYTTTNVAAGGTLRTVDFYYYDGSFTKNVINPALTGTWRAMGAANGASDNVISRNIPTTFQRIA